MTKLEKTIDEIQKGLSKVTLNDEEVPRNLVLWQLKKEKAMYDKFADMNKE